MALVTSTTSNAEEGPSFSCEHSDAGSIEEMVCQDENLSTLDRKLADVYAAASAKAANEHPPVLRAEQRGWIKGRDECWKSDDVRGCVQDEYKRRIAELQARYRLLPGKGPFLFFCDGQSANEVVVTFFATDPPTLIAERGDSVALMYQQEAASGAKYQGRNESFWEHQGKALITWGYATPEMRCDTAP
ncbi:MAG: MliC family protein [Gammaproteobacteria bacterium]